MRKRGIPRSEFSRHISPWETRRDSGAGPRSGAPLSERWAHARSPQSRLRSGGGAPLGHEPRVEGAHVEGERGVQVRVAETREGSESSPHTAGRAVSSMPVGPDSVSSVPMSVAAIPSEKATAARNRWRIPLRAFSPRRFPVRGVLLACRHFRSADLGQPGYPAVSTAERTTLSHPGWRSG